MNIGRIINIDNTNIQIKLDINLEEYSNIMNVHLIFLDGDKKIVGEVTKVATDYVIASVVGEIINNIFLPGIGAKPSFKSQIRIINKEELELIIGTQSSENDLHLMLGESSIYRGYNINVDINQFLSNHFAILGNTGSGKSCTFARVIQNLFTKSKYLPVNANIFLFDAYGEYKNAFSFLHQFNNKLYYKSFTTNTRSRDPEQQLLQIPLWLLDKDDIALLLGATEASQLPIIEKSISLVTILKDTNQDSVKIKNDIVARALLDILHSGKDSIKTRDQIIAILTTYNTPMLNLESEIVQPGYIRTLKQCIYVDNMGKMSEMELVVSFISTFLVDNLEIKRNENIMYDLKDLELALNFALISEGILKSDKVYDSANVLLVRLQSLASGDYNEYFKFPTMIDRVGYIRHLLTTPDNNKAQIVSFNINYTDDIIAKAITKIISRILFETSINSHTRGTVPFHIIIEEAHRYVQKDIDTELLGYNIFDRITKEGRKYGIILGLITQRPSELSETSISQCSNFLVLRTLHPKDLQYIKEMIPNVSEEVLAHLRMLQPGSSIAFGSAFRVPMAIRFEKPNPEPHSMNSDIEKIWYGL